MTACCRCSLSISLKRHSQTNKQKRAAEERTCAPTSPANPQLHRLHVPPAATSCPLRAHICTRARVSLPPMPSLDTPGLPREEFSSANFPTSRALPTRRSRSGLLRHLTPASLRLGIALSARVVVLYDRSPLLPLRRSALGRIATRSRSAAFASPPTPTPTNQAPYIVRCERPHYARRAQFVMRTCSKICV